MNARCCSFLETSVAALHPEDLFLEHNVMKLCLRQMELEVDWSDELHLGEPPVRWREGKALRLCGTSWLVYKIHTLKMSPLNCNL